VRWLLVTANVIRSSPFLVTLMMEALHSSETLALTRAIRRNIRHRRENLKSYMIFFYIPEDCILRSYRPEYRKYYMGFYIPKDGIFPNFCVT
jgi:hypothetical protein